MVNIQHGYVYCPGSLNMCICYNNTCLNVMFTLVAVHSVGCLCIERLLIIALEVNIFWMAHQVHHSSEEYNLSTALRQSLLQRFTSWVCASILHTGRI